MKVVCLISSLQLGGAERQLCGLAAALKRGGADVEILTYRDGDFYAGLPQLAGIPHVRITRRSDPGIIRAIAGHMKGADLLISFMGGVNLKACLARIFYPGFRLIVSERITCTSCHLHDRLRFLLYRKAERVVCNNYSQEQFIRAHAPGLAPRLVTIPNFVDTELFRPAPVRTSADPARIIVTARLSRRKNPEGLVRAAALLRSRGLEFRITWLGLTERDGKYASRLRKLCSETGVESCVEFLPASTSVAEEYRSSDIFCLPSFYEGTSNSLAEALASGLPVACSRVGDNVRYVREAENGFLFDPRSPEEIASALEKLISADAARRAQMGVRSRHLAEELLGAQAFSRVYCRIASLSEDDFTVSSGTPSDTTL